MKHVLRGSIVAIQDRRLECLKENLLDPTCTCNNLVHFGSVLWVHLKKQSPIPYLSSLCRTQPSLWNYASLRIPKDDTTKLCNLGFCCWSYAAFLDVKNAWGSWGSVKHTQNALKRRQNHLIWFGSTPQPGFQSPAEFLQFLGSGIPN